MLNREKVDFEPIQARKDVQTLLYTLTPMLRLAGVTETQINVASGRKYQLRHYIKAFDWLHEFSISLEYIAFCEVYALRPPQTWLNYVAIGVEGLAEQVMLEETGQKLVRRWRQKRPRMFGRDKNVEEENAEQNDNW